MKTFLNEIYEISTTKMHVFFFPVKKFFRWIIKSIQYSIVLWNDFDYDYMFIMKILKYKIERTRKCLDKNKLFVGYEEAVEKMRKAEQLLQQYINHEFVEDLYKAHKEKWGKRKIKFEPIIDKEGSSYITFYTEKAITPEQIKQEREEYHNILREEEKRKNEVKDELFNLIRDNIESWWD